MFVTFNAALKWKGTSLWESQKPKPGEAMNARPLRSPLWADRTTVGAEVTLLTVEKEINLEDNRAEM